MSTNDKPAFLPSADLDDLRDRYITRGIPDFCMEGAPHDVRALLAHIDALTRGAVDEEALGLAAWMARVDEDFWKERGRDLGPIRDAHRQSWEILGDDERSRYGRIGSALYTLGRAAGRIEGEAAPYVCPCCYHQRGDEVPADARSTREQMAAEIARLTAELAAAKGNMR